MLIDGGGSSYTGQRYVDGWLNLIEELSEGGYGGGSIYTVDDAIEKVCNTLITTKIMIIIGAVFFIPIFLNCLSMVLWVFSHME